MGIILSIAGALRREELYKMRVEDIEDRDRLIIVKVPLTKTYIFHPSLLSVIKKRRKT